jgi:hypothetical protein
MDSRGVKFREGLLQGYGVGHHQGSSHAVFAAFVAVHLIDTTEDFPRLALKKSTPLLPIVYMWTTRDSFPLDSM